MSLALFVLSLLSGVWAQSAVCPLQEREPARSPVPFETCSEFSQKACCSYGETDAVSAPLGQQQRRTKKTEKMMHKKNDFFLFFFFSRR